MSRYVDATELFDKVYEDVSAYYEEGKEVKDEILQIIADFHTADVQEVKHGKWIDSFGKQVPFISIYTGCPEDSCSCSICGKWLTASDEYACIGYYCPNCGAKMDLEEKS